MFFWFAVVLIVLVIVWVMGSIIWTLARGSDAQRRKMLTALLLNWHVNSAGQNPAGELRADSARERREAKHVVWQWQREQHQTHAAHSHGGHSSSWHHSHNEGHHSANGGDFGAGHH